MLGQAHRQSETAFVQLMEHLEDLFLETPSSAEIPAPEPEETSSPAIPSESGAEEKSGGNESSAAMDESPETGNSDSGPEQVHQAVREVLAWSSDESGWQESDHAVPKDPESQPSLRFSDPGELASPPSEATPEPPEDAAAASPVSKPAEAEPVPVAPAPEKSSSAEVEPHDAPPPPVEKMADPPRGLRSRLLEIGSAISELDRTLDSDSVLKKLWSMAASRGLRTMMLQEKGKTLAAQMSYGFANFEGAKEGRLRKVVVPLDKDGVFAVTAEEKFVYSGPRPQAGMPVDLILVMGKEVPVWCLIIPLPYRNRWGRFMYVDADAQHLEALLQFDAIARYAVSQLRASRFHRHQPAEKVRVLREKAIQERRSKQSRKNKRVEKVQAESLAEEDAAEDGEDPMAMFTRKKAIDPKLPEEESSAERFDENGVLIQPLDGHQILARMGELPSMPHVAAQVLSMLNDPETPVMALQEIIGRDQALSVRLLKIANSSLYGSMRNCNTISEAVIRLGFTAIRSWLLASVTRSVFLEGEPSKEQEILWRQSVVSGITCQVVAEESRKMDPDIAFVGGLLQNIGLLMLLRSHPEVFVELNERCYGEMRPYHLIEREMMGFDHGDVSALILQHWRLADDLISAVASHHRLDSAGDMQIFAAVIALGEDLALRLGGGPTEADKNDWMEVEACEILGLQPESIDIIFDRVAQLILDRSIFK